MSDPKVEEIRARLAAATPGPWRIEKDSEEELEVGIPYSEWPQSLIGPMQSSPTPWAIDHGDANRIDEVNELSFADAEFIAHAREDIPILLTKLDEAETYRATDRVLLSEALLRANEAEERERALIAKLDETTKILALVLNQVGAQTIRNFDYFRYEPAELWRLQGTNSLIVGLSRLLPSTPTEEGTNDEERRRDGF